MSLSGLSRATFLTWNAVRNQKPSYFLKLTLKKESLQKKIIPPDLSIKNKLPEKKYTTIIVYFASSCMMSMKDSYVKGFARNASAPAARAACLVSWSELADSAITNWWCAP